MPEKKSGEMFNEIKELYGPNGDNFRENIRDYFYTNVFVNEIREVNLSGEEEKKFDAILDKAIKKFDQEQKQLNAPRESRTKRIAKAIGQFIMDLSSFGLWRLLKTPNAKAQFTGLIKYSKKIVQREVARSKEPSFSRSEKIKVDDKESLRKHKMLRKTSAINKEIKARQYGETQFKEYLKLLNEQTANHSYDQEIAATARHDKINEIKQELDKLNLVDGQKVKGGTEERKIAQRRFDELAKAHEIYVVEATKMVTKLGQESRAINTQIETQTKAQKNINSAAKSLEEKMLEYERSANNIARTLKKYTKLEKLKIESEDLGDINQNLNRMLQNNNNLISATNDLQDELNQLTQKMAEMENLQRKNNNNLTQLTQEQQAIKKLKAQLPRPDEVSITTQLNNVQSSATKSLDTIKLEQAKWIKQRETLQNEIKLKNSKLIKLEQRINSNKISISKYKDKYGKAIIAAEIKEAKKYGENLFKEYLKFSNEQVLSGNVQQLAEQERINKYTQSINEKYSGSFKLKGVSRIDEQQIEKYKQIAQSTFNTSVKKRQERVLKAQDSIEKLNAKLMQIKQQAAQQVQISANLDKSARTLADQMLALREKMNISISRVRSDLRKDVVNVRTGNEILEQRATESMNKLNEMREQMNQIKELQKQNANNLNALTQMTEEIEKYNQSNETLINPDLLKTTRNNISEVSNRIKSEQKKWQHQQKDLQSEFEWQAINLAELKTNNKIITAYQKKADALSKQMDTDRRSSSPKAKFYGTLRQKLTQNIKPATNIFGEYTAQRDTVVKLIVKKYAEELEKNPIITSEYLLRNQHDIINRITSSIASKAESYLGQMTGSFDKTAESAAVEVVQELKDSIHKDLVEKTQHKKQVETDLKRALSEVLKKKIPAVSGYSFGAFGDYAAQRDAAVEAFATRFVKELSSQGPIDSTQKKISINMIEKFGLTPLKKFVKENYGLSAEQTRIRINNSLDDVAKTCAKKTAEEIKKEYFVGKAQHSRKWTNLVTKFKGTGIRR